MSEEQCGLKRWDLLKQRLNNLTGEAFLERLARTSGAVLIDVRTGPEFAHGHLAGAINYSYLAEPLIEQLDALDRHVPYFVYCRTGRRSVRVCMLMKNFGFREVYNLDGGLLQLPATFSPL